MIPSTTTTTQIVVEKSTVPVKAAESIANILGHNNKPGVQFQVRRGGHRIQEKKTKIRTPIRTSFIYCSAHYDYKMFRK